MSHPADYPLSLAVEDFVPVVLTAAAAVRLITPAAATGRRGRLTATGGALLIAAGGLSKAVWKLVVALDGPDLHPLDKALFPLLSAGFLLLALALLRLPPPSSQSPAPAPAAAPGAIRRLERTFAVLWPATAAVCLTLRSTAPALVLTVAAVTVCAVRLILLARGAGDTRAAGAAGIWLLGMYVLGPLAARPDQSVALQWVEQSCNTLTQAAVVVAAWRLAAALPGPAAAPAPPHPPGPSGPAGPADDDRTVTP
ncbi:hypothetical protein [Streptomyces sp. NPDC088812]|uniref:hypothetical protein n=1 Tax=Streptomyces sp. NPDC088812 TaxID=3365905 RepID=UPI0037F2B3D2